MCESTDDQKQDDCPGKRRQKRPEDAADIHPKEAQEEPSYQPSNDANDDVAKNAKFIALNQPISNGTSNTTNDNPDNPGPEYS
jgi:hypothetical protein